MDFIKYIRDKIKREYPKADRCYITGKEEELELHHLIPLSTLVNKWEFTSTDMEREREDFLTIHPEVLLKDNLYTLCKTEHKLLHQLYGRTYPVSDVYKVRNWIEKRRRLHGN